LTKEGTSKFIEGNWSNVPSVDDIKAGRADFALNGVESFNKSGDVRLPVDARGRASIVKLPNGQEVVDFHVVGPDGKQMPASARTLERISSMTPAERDAAEMRMFESGRQQQNTDRNFGLHERQIEESTALRRESLGLQRAQMGQTAAHQRDMLALGRERIASGGAGSGGGGRGASAPGEAPVWHADADKLILKNSTIEDPVTGKVLTDAQGAQFAKQIALAASRKNGGDWFSGVMTATEIDNELKRQSGNDPQKLASARNAWMQRASGQAPGGGGGGAPAAAAKQVAPVEQPSISGFVKDRANAVVNGMGVSQPRTDIGKQLEQARTAVAQAKTPETFAKARDTFQQLKAAYEQEQRMAPPMR
jgi:hypothetical protein